MSLLCAISNEIPEVPVLSPSSKCIFERRLIEKYIAEKGVDPISGESLTTEDLIEIHCPPGIKPRPPSATSIPSILKILQDEWDACMLNSFSLRQELQTSRLELSNTLYHHDGACRVIARLRKEVAASREALATLKPHVTTSAGQKMLTDTEMDQDSFGASEEVGMTPEVNAKLIEKAAALTSIRKQRGKNPPEGLVASNILSAYEEIGNFGGLHSPSHPGINCLDVHLADTKYLVTGGNDKSVVVFDLEAEEIVAAFKGHQKKVLKVAYHPTESDIVTSAGADSLICVWSVGSKGVRHTLRVHSAPVTGISIHATGDYMLSVASNDQWAFSDIRSGRLLFRVNDPAPSSLGMTCAQFHPDGLIFGIGNMDSTIKIWDLKERSNVANFPGHAGAIRALSFSENGYYLASVADDAIVKIWDLRKLKNLKSVTYDPQFQPKDLCFDQSGNYLAVAGTEVRILQSKFWHELLVLSQHTDVATGVRFGRNAERIMTTSMDRSLRVYGQRNA